MRAPHTPAPHTPAHSGVYTAGLGHREHGEPARLEVRVQTSFSALLVRNRGDIVGAVLGESA